MGEKVTIKSIPTKISKAIIDVMKAVKKLERSESNKFASYKYASIDDFLEDLRPKLSDAGLSILVNEIVSNQFTVPEIKKDITVDSLFVHYAYDFYLAHLECEEIFGPIRRTVDLRFVGPQTSGQAQSYCEKMFMRSLFKVATGELDADQQEQGDFTKKSPVAEGNHRSGSKEVNKLVDDAIGYIDACEDMEGLKTVYANQYRLCIASGAHKDQLDLIYTQFKNTEARLGNLELEGSFKDKQ